LPRRKPRNSSQPRPNADDFPASCPPIIPRGATVPRRLPTPGKSPNTGLLLAEPAAIGLLISAPDTGVVAEDGGWNENKRPNRSVIDDDAGRIGVGISGIGSGS